MLSTDQRYLQRLSAVWFELVHENSALHHFATEVSFFIHLNRYFTALEQLLAHQLI